MKGMKIAESKQVSNSVSEEKNGAAEGEHRIAGETPETSGTDGQQGGSATQSMEERELPPHLEWSRRIRFKEEDDPLTRLSKTVSWILRHDSSDSGINMDGEKWAEVVDLIPVTEALCDIKDYEDLVKLLRDSNEKKPRYDFEETETGKLMIRAASRKAQKLGGPSPAPIPWNVLSGESYVKADSEGFGVLGMDAIWLTQQCIYRS